MVPTVAELKMYPNLECHVPWEVVVPNCHKPTEHHQKESFASFGMYHFLEALCNTYGLLWSRGRADRFQGLGTNTPCSVTWPPPWETRPASSSWCLRGCWRFASCVQKTKIALGSMRCRSGSRDTPHLHRHNRITGPESLRKTHEHPGRWAEKVPSEMFEPSLGSAEGAYCVLLCLCSST